MNRDGPDQVRCREDAVKFAFEITRRQFGLGAAATLPSLLLPRAARAELSSDAEKALYDAAKPDGEVTWYDAHHHAELAEVYGRAFTTRYPGVKVNVVRTTANIAYQRVAQELKAGSLQCDVLSSTDISHSMDLKTKGLLEKFTPANAATVIPELQNRSEEHTSELQSR